ncbi:hypothetical protein [Nannocystis pusilla]|uniref:hypothetical protein n=1 Tax=Nannocystis pusilla TaxID=889268 RepID=UPI003B7AB6CC
MLVMGDNRNESHDSLAWTRQVEAVAADGLLSVKDLRDLTDEKLFSLTRPDDVSARGDASFDHILYIADHASDAHGLELEIWREPVLGGEAVYRALTAGEGTEASFASLMEGDERIGSKGNTKLRERLQRIGGDVVTLTLKSGDIAQDVVFRLNTADAVMRLRCGNAICRSPGRVAEKVAEVVERWNRDRSQDARQILDGDNTARYSQHWTSRSATAETFIERRYSKTGAEPATPAGLVRLRAWRAPTRASTWSARPRWRRSAARARLRARPSTRPATTAGWSRTSTSSRTCAPTRRARSRSASSAAASAAPATASCWRWSAASKDMSLRSSRTARACPSCCRPATSPVTRRCRSARSRSATSTTGSASTRRSATWPTASGCGYGCGRPRAWPRSWPRCEPRSRTPASTTAWPAVPWSATQPRATARSTRSRCRPPRW